MPRGPMTAEHKEKMRLGRERAKAAKMAADPPINPIPTSPDAPSAPLTEQPVSPQGKILNLPSRFREVAPFRVKKYVKPECQVAQTDDKGNVEYNTGPCQQNANMAMDSTLYTWHKTCPHGPVQDSNGVPIPVGERCYFEEQIYTRRIPIVQNGMIVDHRDEVHYKVTPRIREMVMNVNIAGGLAQPSIVAAKGARTVESFGIAPFCDAFGCFRQENLKALAGGLFCSEAHAKWIRAYEEGIIIPIQAQAALDPNGEAEEVRKKRLATVAV